MSGCTPSRTPVIGAAAAVALIRYRVGVFPVIACAGLAGLALTLLRS